MQIVTSGVLIDDLITKSTDEPYRMFTSRAEYRLLLRQDNADLRLTPLGRKAGLVSDEHWALFEQKRQSIEHEIDRLRKSRDGSFTYAEILRRPEVVYNSLPIANKNLPDDVTQEVEIQLKYEGYIARDLEQIERFHKLENKSLPGWLDYEKIAALRFESRQKLTRYRPDSIGQASRIPGVTPADIAILLVWIKRAGKRGRLGRLPILQDHPPEFFKQHIRVVRPRRCLGMILNAENRQLLVPHPLDCLVIQVNLRDL